MDVNDFFKTYSKIVVFDTQFTTWEGAYERHWSGEDEYREIFQISALKIDLVKEDVIDSFERFVYPRKNPLLSEYAKEFTGISQNEIDHGVDFREMYIDFLAWSDMLPLCSYSRTKGEEGEGLVIKENIDLYKLDVPYDANRFINLVEMFKQIGVDVENFSSGTLHDCFELELPGHLHNAIHDVKSIAVAVLGLKDEAASIREEYNYQN